MRLRGYFRPTSSAKFFLAGLALMLGLLPLTAVLPARASVLTTTITPAWNLTATQETTYNGCVPSSTYTGEVGPDNTLFSYTETPFSCDDLTESARMGLTFGLTDIPASATVTKVELLLTVQVPSPASQTIHRVASDTPNLLDSTTADLFTALAGTGSPYGAYTNWMTTGSKTLDLGSSAVTDVQQRVQNGHTLAISLTSSSDDYGSVYSAAAAIPANRPGLRVTYALTPTAPTAFTLASKTTTSLTWSWLDQAVSETDNQVRDQTGTTVCTAGAVSGTGNAVGCLEIGLVPNTLYTRHATAIDSEGATNSPDVSVSTNIEIPTGVSVTSVGQSSAALAALGTMTNLRRGFSGVNFGDGSSGLTSGWTQINNWLATGLQPNTAYAWQAQGRNGDGQTTPWSSTTTIFTLARDAQASSSRQANAWYNTPDFQFTNTAGWGPGGIQYYRYAWTTDTTYSFTGQELTWSSSNANCPTGQCTQTGQTLTVDAIHDGQWYLHLQSFNGDQVASGKATSGPWLFDGTTPSAPTSVSLTDEGDSRYTNALSSLTASWVGSGDGLSGLREYQYALGTTPGGTDILGFTGAGTQTSAALAHLQLRNGTTCYLTVRALDQAGNVSPSLVTRGMLVNTISPVIIDRQTGDPAHRRLSGTTYNIDFLKSASGPALGSAQYVVYTKPNLGGQRVMNWTNIFRGSRLAMTTDWSVNFSGLREGMNYISVRTTGLDGLVTTRRDVFTITKDTTPAPVIKGLLMSTFSHRQSSAELLILGRNFRPGAKVMVGSLPATRVTLNAHGQLAALVPIGRLKVGRYSLRVLNTNGLDVIRPSKVFIVSS